MGWFGDSYKGYEFKLFSFSHFVILAILLFVSIGIFLNRARPRGEKWRYLEIGIAISLLMVEGTYHLWLFVNGNWNVRIALPLDLCSILLIITVLLLFTKKKFYYELLFFAALLGPTQALLVPSLLYDFPHFRFFHFFYTHLIFIWVSLYFTWVKGYRPTFWSVIKLFVFLNLLLPLIIYINKLVGANYMFLSHKPIHKSLLDVLGPYPWYILSMEGLLITLSLIVWWIFRERVLKSRSNQENSVGR
jgi:hypothetical integral membrane protein (TIGR02206 family)